MYSNLLDCEMTSFCPPKEKYSAANEFHHHGIAL